MVFQYQYSFISIIFQTLSSHSILLDIPEHQNEDIQADYKPQKLS